MTAIDQFAAHAGLTSVDKNHSVKSLSTDLEIKGI